MDTRLTSDRPATTASPGPTTGSRTAALVALPVLAVAGLALADALTGDLLRGASQGRLAPEPPTAEVTGGDRQVEERGCGCADSASDAQRPAPPIPPDMDGRAWAERLAGGQHEDPVPPPPGAKHLFRMAGGYTFYRLRADTPAAALRGAISHYRRTLADGGWQTLVDRSSASTGGTGHLIVASRDGRTVDIFVHQRRGVARAVVRSEPEP